MSHPAAPSPSALKGVLLVSLAVLVFAVGDVLTKVLAMRWNVPLVGAVRYALNFVLLVAFLAPHQGWGLFRVRRTGLVLLRSASLTFSSVTMGLALQLIPVGEAVAIMYMAPFIVMLVAAPLLGEKVGRAGLALALTGFVGIILIVRPGAGLNLVGLGLAFLTAMSSVVYHVMTRKLSDTETTGAILVWTAGLGAVVFGAMVPFNLDVPLPGIADIAMFAGLGVAATLGHFLFTAAYREAPASYLAPVNYMHIVWATGLGWLVFGHAPDTLTVAGMAVVILSGAAAATLRPARR